jgi:hypothetical protein
VRDLIERVDNRLSRSDPRLDGGSVRFNAFPPWERKDERVIAVADEFGRAFNNARRRAPLDDRDVRQVEHAQPGVKAPLVRHVDIDAHDAQHQFLAPGVEAVALVECVAREQDRRGGRPLRRDSEFRHAPEPQDGRSVRRRT